MTTQSALKYENWQTRHLPASNKHAWIKAVLPTHIKDMESQGEVWKAKQLKEYRRANGLCYKCGEKYALGHKCKVPTQP